MATEAAKKNLRTKLAEACDATGGVEKKGRNEKQNYSYVKAADVAKEFRHELFRRGVVLIPHEKEFIELNRIKTQSGGELIAWKLTVDYTLLDSDSDEKLTFQAFGVGMDSGDKAIYKCKTGALKYFLRGLGLIPDEKDDPEADESVDRAIAPAMPRPPKKAAPIRTVDGIYPIADETLYVHVDKKGMASAANKPNGEDDPAKTFTKHFWATAKKNGKSEEQVRNFFGSIGYEHTAEIPPTKYAECYAWAETR